MRTEGIKYYKTTVLSVHVGDTMITSDKRLQDNVFNGTIWDTGSPHMWLPSWLYAAVKAVFDKMMAEYERTRVNGINFCYIISRKDALLKFPLFRFEMPDNIWLELEPSRYLASVEDLYGKLAQCVDIHDSHSAYEGISFGLTNMQNMLISYDYSNKRLGFMKHDCNCFLLPEAKCIDGKKTKGGPFSLALSTRLPHMALATLPKLFGAGHRLKLFLTFILGSCVGGVGILFIALCRKKQGYAPLPQSDNTTMEDKFS